MERSGWGNVTMMTNTPTLGSVGSCDAWKRRPLKLEVNERLQIRRDELVEHKDGHDHDETHEPKREHGEVDAVPAFPTVRKPVDGLL